MTTTNHTARPYLWVFFWLFVLTVIELCVARLPLARGAVILLLIGLAVTKAMFVALYYMHLKYDRGLLVLIAASPFLLSVILTLALFPDIGFR